MCIWFFPAFFDRANNVFQAFFFSHHQWPTQTNSQSHSFRIPPNVLFNSDTYYKICRKIGFKCIRVLDIRAPLPYMIWINVSKASIARYRLSPFHCYTVVWLYLDWTHTICFCVGIVQMCRSWKHKWCVSYYLLLIRFPGYTLAFIIRLHDDTKIHRSHYGLN